MNSTTTGGNQSCFTKLNVKAVIESQNSKSADEKCAEPLA